jgi:hypothetical protein
MEKTKMTNVKALTYVVENFEMPAEVAEKIGNILATYEKKSASTGERKPTEKQIADAATAEQVLAWVNEHRGETFTVGDIMKNCPACAELPSTQKLTPMLTKLVEANRLGKVVVQRRNHYTAI